MVRRQNGHLKRCGMILLGSLFNAVSTRCSEGDYVPFDGSVRAGVNRLFRRQIGQARIWGS